MECNFRIGQKVVCIDDDRKTPKGHVILTEFETPKVGRIYTVRGFVEGQVRREVCLLLEEIPDQDVSVFIHGDLWIASIAFEASAFRPLVKRKTDISVFKALLTQQHDQVPA